MKKFLDENFLLNSRTAQLLYHEYACEMPIMDYHNHLPADQIAKDLQFENITRLLLNGDHYGHFSQADIENGELPNDIPWIGKVVRDICYYNTKTI